MGKTVFDMVNEKTIYLAFLFIFTFSIKSTRTYPPDAGLKNVKIFVRVWEAVNFLIS